MRTFWSVFVPMTRSGIIGSALIVFVFSLGFFVTPAILGGGRSVMVAELIYLRIFQSPDWGLGAAISVVLVLFVGALMALLFRYVRPKQLELMPTYRPGPVSLVLAALVGAVPAAAAACRHAGVVDAEPHAGDAVGELSLRHYRALIEDPALVQSILLSSRDRRRQQRHLDRAGAVLQPRRLDVPAAVRRRWSASCCCRWWCRPWSRPSRSISC